MRNLTPDITRSDLLRLASTEAQAQRSIRLPDPCQEAQEAPRSPLILPTVHLNGTSREELQRLRLDACHALNFAMEALSDMAPNCRDYYVSRDPEAMTKAGKQHNRRMETLRTLRDEIYAEIEALDEE